MTREGEKNAYFNRCLGRGRLTVVAQASGYAPCWSKVNVRTDAETVLDLELIYLKLTIYLSFINEFKYFSKDL